MANIISQLEVTWQDPIHGAVNMYDEVEDLSRTDNRSAETVFNVAGLPIGVKYVPGAQGFTFTQRTTTAPLIDWDRLRTEQITGLMIIEEKGGNSESGRRRTYECAVMKVDDSYDNAGENTMNIELTVLRSDRTR